MFLKYFVIAVPILMVAFFNPLISFLSIYTYCTSEMLPFDASQIRVYLYEDLVQRSPWLIEDLFNFLQVDPSFTPDTSIRPNKSGVPKNSALHQLLTKPNPIKSLLKPLFPAKLRQKIQHNNLETPKLSPEVRQSLMKLYREDILVCQDLIGRDLSAWLSH